MIRILRFARKPAVILHNFKRIIADPERKVLPKICWEFIRCSLANKCIAFHYFSSLLYRRNIHNILDYIPRPEERKIQDRINDPKVGNLISNKLSFLEHFQRGGFPVPRLFAYSVLDKIYLKVSEKWEMIELSSPRALKEHLERLMSLWGIEEIFMKPIVGSQGLGADKITRARLNEPIELMRLHSVITRNSYIFQQVVTQHPELSRLNPTSLNTIRIDTFRQRGCQAEILSAFLRVGGKGNKVDNVSAGGIFVDVNLKDGKLKETALNSLHGSSRFGSFKTTENGIIFDSFQIPLFDEVKKTIQQAADYIPPAMVGWDVAIGNLEPVLIEANCLYYGLNLSDMAYGGYRKNPVYRKALACANLRE